MDSFFWSSILSSYRLVNFMGWRKNKGGKTEHYWRVVGCWIDCASGFHLFSCFKHGNICLTNHPFRVCTCGNIFRVRFVWNQTEKYNKTILVHPWHPMFHICYSVSQQGEYRLEFDAYLSNNWIRNITYCLCLDRIEIARSYQLPIH